MTAVFTASSHHPYEVPEKYKDVYPEEGISIHKCIRYTDMAISKFFQRVSSEPWFQNTIFVLTRYMSLATVPASQRFRTRSPSRSTSCPR